MSQQINLFNPIFMKQRKYFTLFTMVQALGLIIVGSLFFYGYAVYQVAQLSKQSEQTSQQLKAEQARFVRYVGEFSPQQATQLLQAEVKRLEELLAEQTKLADKLRSGSDTDTPAYSQYMRAFARQTLYGLWLTDFNLTEDGSQISLSGGVINPELLPAYIERLGKEPAMQGKTFTTLQMQQHKEDTDKANKSTARYVEFTLHSTPEGEAKQ